MAENIKSGDKTANEPITSTIFCVNTNCAYIYEIVNHDIVKETKVFMKA
jgi:hypothetical protein